MRFLPKRAYAGVLAVLLIASAPALAQQVMSMVPDDALVVLRFKNLSATSDKLGKLLTDLGVAAMKPGLDKPLQYLQNESGISKGLNAAGDMAVVFRDPDVTKSEADESVIILVPVSDYNAFVANFGNAQAVEGVTEVKMPKSEAPGYIAHWGDFAAMSPSKECVSTKPANMFKVTGAALTRDLAERDVVVIANFKTIGPKATKHLHQAREMVLSKIDEEEEEKLAKFKPLLKAAVNQLFVVVEAFLRDTTSATATANFDAEGVNVGVMAEFTPGTYMANATQQLKNSSEPLLIGLPTGKYLFYGGYITQPEITTKLLNDFMAPILKEVDAMGPEMKPAHDYVDALSSQFRATKGGSFGIVAPTGMIGQEALFQMVGVVRGDAPAIKAAQLKLVQSQADLMKSLGLPAEAFTSKVTPNAKTVEGVNFDSIATNMPNNPSDPAMAQQLAMMKMIYGANGVNLLVGEVSKDVLMIAMGVNDQVISGAIAAAKANDAPVANSAPVKLVAGHLPKERTMELYIPIDQIVATAMNYARMFGAPLNVQLQPDLPPIGFVSRSDGTATRFDGYVPTQLVQQLVSAGMQVWMQTQGGGPGGR